MKNYTVQEVASFIDHAVLKPEQTLADLETHAALCMEFATASLCVRPCDVKAAAALLQDSSVKTSCVLSFPHGADTTAVKVRQAQQAIDDGVQEIDMVMNIGRFMSGREHEVLEDIRAVVDTAHAADVYVKVIQESCYLTLEQVRRACGITMEAGADFVKTSTGFGPSSATPDLIAAMKEAVGGRIGIKASGGIRTWQQACAYLEQGVTRLGLGATRTVLEGGRSLEGY